MSDTVIKVENLSKIYKLYKDPIDRLKEALNPFGKKYHNDFYALKDVSFEVKRGETIGIIGKNGSGKSTLLKILTGVLTETSGKVSVRGKVSSLLELGAGFNPELSGIENVYFNGSILGYSREEMDSKLAAILEFADIGEFVYQSVKTYSSGMQVRLAFAVAISVDPDVLIVDEALAVGDMFFQAKCMTRMKQMIDSGVTLVLVSHSPGAVKSLCKKTILLNGGAMVDFDKSNKVIEKYFELKVKAEQEVLPVKDIFSDVSDDDASQSVFHRNSKFKKRAAFQRIQNGMAHFENVQILSESGKEVEFLEYNQTIILRMALSIDEDIVELSYGYHIRDVNGVEVVYSSAGIEGTRLKNVKKGEKYVIDWKFKVPLMHGLYNVACVASIPVIEESKVCFCDFIPIAAQFHMNNRKVIDLYGFVHLENIVNIIKLDS